MSSGFDCYACEDDVGGWEQMVGPLLQAGGGIAQGAIADSEKGDAQDKATAEDKKAASAAIAADVDATLALARANTSIKLNMPSAKIDKLAADNAAQAQARAGASLSQAASEARIKAAESALDTATKKAQANPKDTYANELVNAWMSTLNKAQNRQIIAADDEASGGGGKKGKKGASVGRESWLTRKVVGPVPGWGVLVGGGGLVAIVGTIVKKVFFPTVV